MHDPGPWVDGGNHPRVGLEAPELTTESKGIGTSAAPETIEGLDVEEEAANAGAKHIGGHAGLTHDVFALEDGPGMKRHARIFVISDQRLDLGGAAYGKRRLIVLGHPVHAVVGLEDEAEIVIA